MSSLPPAAVNSLKQFVQLLESQPALLHDPALDFFREYLLSLSAELPKPPTPPPKKEDPPQDDHPQDEAKQTDDVKMEETPEPEEDEEEPESDLELDMTGVIEDGDLSEHEMGAAGGCEPETEAEMDAFDEARSAAMAAMGDGEFEKAIELFTDAIKLNPKSAAMFAERGTCFLKMKRCRAAIRDCDRAIDINPDNAAAHKLRGRAHRLLGNFKAAAKDLRIAYKFPKIDFKELADELLREVNPNGEYEERLKAMQAEMEMRQSALMEAQDQIRTLEEKLRETQAAKDSAEASGLSGGGGGGVRDLSTIVEEPSSSTSSTATRSSNLDADADLQDRLNALRRE